MAIIDDSYKKVVLDDTQKEAVKSAVKDWVDGQVSGLSDDEKRVVLPKLRGYVNQCVGEVSLPTGVDRVDGYAIRPLLNEVINEEIALLPVPEEPAP